jgi:uncharacterized protein (DUF983 family)
VDGPSDSAGSPATVPPLPASTGERLRLTLWRAIRRRCPYCGAGGIFRNYFELREACPACHTRFEREEGYFLGAYALNLIVAEFLGLGLAIWLLFRTRLQHLDLIWQEAIAIGLAVLLPIVFFPYSRLFWIVMDLTFHPPRGADERQLRGHQIDADERRR